MLKQLITYRIGADWSPNADLFLDSLEREAFQPCGPTQALSAGWVPPRGEEGAPLLEQVAGHWLLTLRMEKRILPSSVVREHTEERLDQIEDETGRRPGKKQARDIAEQVTLELLPRAFTTQSHLKVWISPAQRLLMVEASSIGKADDLITLLVKADPSLNLHLLQSAQAPAACMGAWLMDGVPPEGFTIDRDCELKAADEMKSVVKYGRHNLDTDELRSHLASGKMPTRLAMTWKERISFTLTDTLQVKGIKFLDVVFDGRDKPAKDEAFDVDAALATGELSQLIPALIEALGGELDFIGQSKKVAAEHAAAPAATEKQVRMAAKLYEVRDSARTIMRGAFGPRMKQLGEAIRAETARSGRGDLEAAQDLIKQRGLTEFAAVEMLAAAVELVEPTA
ncbi:recombination-associated protein RdgC [Roseateles sp. SL47]|uniref:recombination-associated protein RdgC n=1 Tax=Roseateles sp. SL47 TaxID=2995138 RepID=UPI0022715907|nr:recombination-associated protein RdgC [Roseateles sp. SL47]WAC75335.1 recombination-associated protein RdgC [Roseateles sp. SL47]